MKKVDLTQVHYLSGPFEVEGAKPGDILLVEIMDVQPFQDQPWGFTGVFPKENGGGFLDEIYPSAYESPLPLGLKYVFFCLSASLIDIKLTHETRTHTEPRRSGTSKASTAPRDTCRT